MAIYRIGRTNAEGTEIIEFPIRFSDVGNISIPSDLTLAELPEPFVVVQEIKSSGLAWYEISEHTGFEVVDGKWCTKNLVSDLSEEEIREQLKEEVTEKRWRYETGGLELPNGVVVSTGIDDQNRITSAIANAERAGIESVNFKSAMGWVTLTMDDLRGISVAISFHVQHGFDTERLHHEAIDAASLEDLKTYDITTGWSA